MKLKYDAMKTPKYKEQKADRLAMMKEIRTKGTFSNVRDYLVTANRISGKNRIESRMRVHQIIAARSEGNNNIDKRSSSLKLNELFVSGLDRAIAFFIFLPVIAAIISCFALIVVYMANGGF